MICSKCAHDLSDNFVFCPYCGQKTKSSPPVRRRRTRGNGQGTVYKRGTAYVAVVTLGYYTDGDKLKRITRSKRFSTKKEAVAFLPELRNGPAAQSHLSLVQLWTDYSTSQPYAKLSGSQQFKLAAAWKRWKSLEARDITTLTIADIEDTILAETSSYYPARDMKVVLSHLYEIAVKREIVPANKAEQADLPYPAPKAKRECWTSEEVAAMWSAWHSGSEIAGYALLMCYTGMRFGEVFEMPLTSIHLDERYMIGGEKTDAGRNREIPICDAILPVLRALMAPREKYLIEQNKQYFYDRFRAMLAENGIRPLPMQTCRHFYFTALTAAGVQSGLITEVGGHASYLTTMRNYVRISLADKLAAVNQIPVAVPLQSPAAE